ncbi:MAG: 30S ribosomal protein S8 [Candidatus Nealsonbacteria bacterium RIFCSPLOWO2_02_39_8]|uniref:Small ribosomal subunit protein uS8 n=1 Tax=Candidatus Nealsonbacteria bacterium RIFCSPLOWO2_02_39_8 TaxID=1801674 RepID=A0A1G2EGY7_9BACT|nr:MAG: 30S ribosomal protein S8 [Candidatus Nealsonbacteria bacterium RIFCSPLOWO2_02_39_8]
MMTDPISDMFNRIRNAQAVFHQTADVPFSNLKFEIAKILEKEGFIAKAEKKGKKNKKVIEVILRYNKGDGFSRANPAIETINRVSRPGQRIYIHYKDTKRIRDGFGIAIISTSKGLMTNKEARKQKTGGEVICEVW